MMEEQEVLLGVLLLGLLIINAVILLSIAGKKNAVKDAFYSFGMFFAILSIGAFVPEPYNEYCFAVTVVGCFSAFPFFCFGLIEIRRGKLQWVLNENDAVPKAEKKVTYSIANKGVCIRIE